MRSVSLMRRTISFIVAFTFLGIALMSVGCAMKDSPTSGSSTPTPDPDPKPGGDQGPAKPIAYDPTKPDIKIELAKFSSALVAKDPATKEWTAKNGKIAEVEGIMGSITSNDKTGREVFRLRAENGDVSRAIRCELMALTNWQLAGPGRKVTVVGVLDVKDHGPRGTDISLNDAIIVSIAGHTHETEEIAAEQIGKDYAADPKGFDKKWKAEDKYFYVTGTLKRIEATPLTNSPLVANAFVIAAGPTDLRCQIQNGRGVEANPPKPGEKVTMLVECLGYAAGFEAISMDGVYAGKGP
jgi:hypothetical protein